MTALSTGITPFRELRVHDRAEVRAPAKILVDDALPKEVATLDISVSGLGILTAQQLRRGQSCVCALDLPLDGQVRRINAWGTVVYSVAHDSGKFRAGIKFSDIDLFSRMHIEELCRQAAH